MPLGNGLFAVSEAMVNGNPELMLVDPAIPITLSSLTRPVPRWWTRWQSPAILLYTASSQGLTIYNIGTFEAIPLTVVGRGAEQYGGVDRGQLLSALPPTQVIRARPSTPSSGTRR